MTDRELKGIPINGGLPGGIIKAIEDVQEHGTNIARVGPVSWLEGRLSDSCTGIRLLESVSTTPDSKGKNEENPKCNLGAYRTTDLLQIKEISPDTSGKDLRHPVQKTVQGLGSGIEVRAVDGVLLVDVEPIGREEHGEQEKHKRFEFKRFVQPPELALPGWVLHQDDAGAVLSDNVVGIAEREGKKRSAEHEHDEPDVSAIAHCHIGLDVDVFAQGNLYE